MPRSARSQREHKNPRARELAKISCYNGRLANSLGQVHHKDLEGIAKVLNAEEKGLGAYTLAAIMADNPDAYNAGTFGHVVPLWRSMRKSNADVTGFAEASVPILRGRVWSPEVKKSLDVLKNTLRELELHGSYGFSERMSEYPESMDLKTMNRFGPLLSQTAKKGNNPSFLFAASLPILKSNKKADEKLRAINHLKEALEVWKKKDTKPNEKTNSFLVKMILENPKTFTPNILMDLAPTLAREAKAGYDPSSLAITLHAHSINLSKKDMSRYIRLHDVIPRDVSHDEIMDHALDIRLNPRRISHRNRAKYQRVLLERGHIPTKGLIEEMHTRALEDVGERRKIPVKRR